MKYRLRNLKNGLFFKGYDGQGKSLGNKPTWTKQADEAVEYSSKIGLKMKLRLECQSQIVILVPVHNMQVRKQLQGIAYPISLHTAARRLNHV